MYKKDFQAGYSFVEVLVAIAVLLISIVGPLTIASTGLRNATFAREQNVAFFLAQEGIESVVYLRENAGLEKLHSGSNSWSWISSLPADCRSGDPCRVDVEDFTFEECDPESECDIYLHESGAVRYSHTASDGVPTPYNRKLYFTSVGENALHVRSVVTWYTTAFGEDRDIEIETYLYDIYAN